MTAALSCVAVRMHRRIASVIWCAVVLVVGLGGASPRGQPPNEGLTDTNIRIGVEADVGSLSLDGENQGFKMAFEEANARGGVHLRRFEWIERRRRSLDPADVLTVARRMIDEDGVFALVNFSGPAIGDIVAHARSRRVPVLFPHTALVSSEGERYLFTSFPRFEGEAEAMYRYLARDRGLTRLAIAHDPNAYGLTFRDRLQALAGTIGYDFAGAVPIPERRPGDVSGQMAALVAMRPDAIVMALYPEQAQAVMRARARAGWPGVMVSSGPLTDEASLALPDGSTDGTLGFCHYPDPERSTAPGVVRYREALARLRPGRTPDRYTLYGYTFGRLVIEGLERAGRDLTRERFIDAMEGLRDWDAGGVMPAVSFSPSDHHAQRAGFICEMKEGRLVAVTGWMTP